MRFSKYDYEKSIENLIKQYNCEIIDKELVINYIEKHCLRNVREIIKRFCNNNEIKCPFEYLNHNYIFSLIMKNYDYEYIYFGQYVDLYDFDYEIDLFLKKGWIKVIE